MSMRFVFVLFALLLSALPLRAEVKIQEVISPGGIKAWLVQEPSIPMLSFDISFKGGASLDREGKEGAVYLMSGLLEEGTGDLDFAGFRREQEALAAEFGFDASLGSVSISATMLKSNATEALDLLRRAVAEPAFPQEAIDRVKSQIESIIKRDAQDPNAVARTTHSTMVFAGHPYAKQKEGTLESIAAMTREDLIEAHQFALTKDRIDIGVVGDVTAEELGIMLDNLLGQLPETGAELPNYADYTATPGVTVVDFETPQSVVIWSQPGLRRDSEEFFSAFLLNHILGGGSFTSRLTKEVREKRGLTYGISSFLASFEYGDYYGGQFASSNERVAEAITVVREEWADVQANGVTEEELVAAKKFLTGAYPLRFDGNARIASILTGMQIQDFAIDYINGRNDRVNAVTLEEVNEFAAKFIDPDNLRFVVVGKPEGVTQQ